ncbi:MAG: acyl-CoA dehydrogenase family protein [Pseudomonadota bacterium]
MDDDIRMIADATGRIFADLADLQTVNAASDAGFRAPLWDALQESGITRAWLAEEAGGAGLPIDGGFEILRVAGHHACPVALAETLLAGWALAEAGLEVPEGVLTLAPIRGHDALVLENGALSGTARSIPHAADAAALVVVHADQVMRLAPGSYTVSPRDTDMGGERADVLLDGATPDQTAMLSGAAGAVEAMGAVARACQMTGALETALALATDYTGEREAFGRKIGKFQAVQQMMARLAGEVAAAITASGSAADTLSRDGLGSDAAFLEVAAAKIRVGEAAHEGAMIAHQAHGAIGWTSDYVLQRLTRRIWGWRDDFGSEADWAVRLGRFAAGQGADQLWPMLTTR